MQRFLTALVVVAAVVAVSAKPGWEWVEPEIEHDAVNDPGMITTRIGDGGAPPVVSPGASINDAGIVTTRIGDGGGRPVVHPCDQNNGGCEHICAKKGAKFTCDCKIGYKLTKDLRTCGDIDECATKNGQCTQTCANSKGSFACGCKEGYRLNKDGSSCDDVDECLTDNGGCEQVCENRQGSRTCGCHTGFATTGNGVSCEAPQGKECNGKGGCMQQCANLKNVPTDKDDFVCACKKNEGFVLAKDGKTCNEAAYKNQEVSCLSNGKGISVKITSDDYKHFSDRTRLQVGTCKFNKAGTIEADAETCGIEAKVEGETIKYSTQITDVAKEGSMITRDPKIQVDISCTWCCKVVNEQTESNYDPDIKDIIGKITMHAVDHTYNLQLTLVKPDGTTPKTDEIVTVPVGNRVTLKATVTGDGTKDVKVRAEKCWTTDTNGAEDKKLTYVLMENSCPVDNTFNTKIIDNGKNQQLAFKSYVYTNDRKSQIQIHCDLVACNVADNCGECVETVRRRRSAVKILASKMAVTEIEVLG